MACANSMPDRHLQSLMAACLELAAAEVGATVCLSLPATHTSAVYSMVKFGGVRNYLVGTFNQTDLEACADLNLPCADITAFLPEALNYGEEDAGKYATHNYYVSTLPCRGSGGSPDLGWNCLGRVIRSSTLLLPLLPPLLPLLLPPLLLLPLPLLLLLLLLGRRAQVVCWIRPAVLVHLLEQGYTVLSIGKRCTRRI